jgi:FkbM family methyltransferase
MEEYINNNYLKINKNNKLFLIKNDVNNLNLPFWKNTYTHWENETFEIFDKYLSKDKIFIDIGGWIGTTAMYGSIKSKHVYSIEADNMSFNDMKTNMKANCANNYTLINKAIFNIDNMKIKFGKNMHLENSKMNDSTSQIYSDDEISSEYYLTETITLNSIIKEFEINVNDISLIKVDIDGGEENILDELYVLHIKCGVPLYVRLYYSLWRDKNLDRFSFLSQDIKNHIISNPFVSITFQNV